MTLSFLVEAKGLHLSDLRHDKADFQAGVGFYDHLKDHVIGALKYKLHNGKTVYSIGGKVFERKPPEHPNQDRPVRTR